MPTNLIQSVLTFFAKNSWIAWLWTAMIFIVCNLPAKNIPDGPFPFFDKIVHLGLFGAWTLLWLLAYPEKAIQIILLGFAYGVGIEIAQQLLSLGRTFDWWDAAVDAVGVILAFGFKSIVLDRYLQRLY